MHYLGRLALTRPTEHIEECLAIMTTTRIGPDWGMRCTCTDQRLNTETSPVFVISLYSGRSRWPPYFDGGPDVESAVSIRETFFILLLTKTCYSGVVMQNVHRASTSC